VVVGVVFEVIRDRDGRYRDRADRAARRDGDRMIMIITKVIYMIIMMITV